MKRLLLASLVLSLSTACGGGSQMKLVKPESVAEMPSAGAAAREERCSAGSRARQLTVGWDAATRVDLQARAQNGIAVVRYQDCQVRVLADCRVRGQYAFSPMVARPEQIDITKYDRLEALMPDVARELAEELKRAGGLSLLTSIVGQYFASAPSLSVEQLQGNCEGATHFVTSMSAGAFELKSLDDRLLARGGVQAACAAATADGARPPPQCDDLVQIELLKLGVRGEGEGEGEGERGRDGERGREGEGTGERGREGEGERGAEPSSPRP